MILNSDRHGMYGSDPKNGVVVHDSEGSEGGNSAAVLVAALTRPGDRLTNSGNLYGAGYSAVARETSGYTELVDTPKAAPYHAPPSNGTFWAICIPGRASQTREQWLDSGSRPYIRGVAHYIVDKWLIDGRVWPLEFCTAAELIERRGNLPGRPCGYTSHKQIADAFRQTDHWDPGPSFPWDVLAADIAAIVAGIDLDPVLPANPKEDDVAIKILRSMTDPPEFNAQFVAVVDGDGHSIEVLWSGDGSDPKVASHMRHLRAAGIEEQHILLAGLRDNVLHPKDRPVDIADSLHEWTIDDFAP